MGKENPNEIQSFIRENRDMVEGALSDRLGPDTRPTPQEMIERGLLPNGSYGYHQLQSMRMEKEESPSTPSVSNSESSATEIDPLDDQKIHKSPREYREQKYE